MAEYYDKAPDTQVVTLPMGIFRYTYTDNDPESPTETYCIRPHIHKEIELLLIESGEMIVSIDQVRYRLKKGDAIIANSFEIHSGVFGRKGGNCTYLCLTFSTDNLSFLHQSILSKAADELDTLAYGFETFYPAETAVNPVINECVTGIYHYSEQKTRYSECLEMSYFFKLMAVLFESSYKKIQVSTRSSNVDFIKKVQEIVGDRYKELLTTSIVSGEMYMTPSRFCQLFKVNFGCSFLTYLSRYRIRKAKAYIDSNMTVAEIASAVGFSDYCYFSRLFREQVGVSPSVFFRKRKNKN